MPPGTRWIDQLPTGFGAVVTPSDDAAEQGDGGARRSTGGGAGVDTVRTLADVERDAILAALEAYEGNVSKAARALGVSRGTLYNKLARYRGGDAAA